MSIHFDETAPLLVQIEQAQQQKVELSATTQSLTDKINMALATFIAFIYRCGLAWYGASSLKGLLEAFKARGIKEPEGEQNKWLPIIYLVAGRWNPDGEKVKSGKRKGKVKWDRDTRFNKYANALRYLEENRVPADQALDVIIKAGGVTKLVELDRANHPALREPDAKTVKAAEGLKGLGSVKVDQPEWADEVAFGMAFGRFEDGKFVILGFQPESAKTARAKALTLVKDNTHAADLNQDDKAAEALKKRVGIDLVAFKAAELGIKV
jgi:hypothetical protein